ncbi:TPA: dolichyl-phosphate-mannose--protein mannosyltransferase, partial [Legionella pneumophila]|nr:dolichyl-phosphate-mannose--protein mannosyltransferase [Legionella pneumophila]
MSFQTDKEIQQKFFNYTLFVLVVLLICRLIANYFFPLFDTTESRYAEIARKMLETGNWV